MLDTLKELLTVVLQILVPIGAVWVGTIIKTHVTNQEMRDALLGGLDNGVKYGLARVAGAATNAPLTARLAIPVLVEGLNYVKTFTPDAAAWFEEDADGSKDKNIVKKLAARLPELKDGLSDADLSEIVELARKSKK